jgi:hypothetical protein
MEESLEYWEEKLVEFEEALEREREPELRNDDMIRLLKREIEYCKKEIHLLKDV